ncbi:MAG: HAD-IA family hydrolase [Planctomycetota bacterium]
MPLQAVLLDVGNTLLYEQPPRHAIYAAAARARDLDVEDARMLTLMREAHHALPVRVQGAYRYTDPWFERFIERIFVESLGLPREALAALTAELFDRFESADTFRFFDGAPQFLEAVRERGLTLGVVSNWSERLPLVLAAMGIAEAFDFVVCSALEGCEKPDPEIFLTALRHAGCRAEEAVHCGDHPLKDGMAVQVGMRAVLVDHFGSHPKSDLPRVGDFEGLQAWIDERCA